MYVIFSWIKKILLKGIEFFFASFLYNEWKVQWIPQTSSIKYESTYVIFALLFLDGSWLTKLCTGFRFGCNLNAGFCNNAEWKNLCSIKFSFLILSFGLNLRQSRVNSKRTLSSNLSFLSNNQFKRTSSKYEKCNYSLLKIC